MPATRTDVHRPAALVPEDYDFRGVIDLFPGEDRDDWGAELRHQLFAVEGRKHASVHPHGQCDHCGARIRYAAYLVHRPSGRVLTVGETCLDNRFERSSEEFHALRRRAELDRAAHRIKFAREAFLQSHEDLRLLEAEPGTEGGLPADSHDILFDLRHSLRAYGSLSEPQVRLARKLLTQDAERRERIAAESEAVAIPDAMLGKVTLDALVLGITWRENAYGGAWKALLQVEVEGGAFKVWTTAPAAAMAGAGDATALKGQRVRWSGTLQLSERFGEVDPTFGILKRPRVAG